MLANRHGPTITDSFLTMVAANCPELEHLELSGALGISDAGVAQIAASPCGATLVSVQLAKNTIFNQERFWMGETLGSLYGGITAASAKRIKALPNIRSWMIIGFPNFAWKQSMNF